MSRSASRVVLASESEPLDRLATEQFSRATVILQRIAARLDAAGVDWHTPPAPHAVKMGGLARHAGPRLSRGLRPSRPLRRIPGAARPSETSP